MQKGDLGAFRSATRTLLGEYTEHYARQRIQNESVREARAQSASASLSDIEASLANAVRCDRLDKVTLTPGGNAEIAWL